jgi:LPS-assembly protein
MLSSPRLPTAADLGHHRFLRDSVCGQSRALAPYALAIALMCSASTAFAQDAMAGAAPEAAPETATPLTAPSPAPVAEIAFAADDVAYDNGADIITATGNVELEREAWRLKADQVVWNRTTGRVTATGNVVITSPQGDTAYGDSIELTDTLRDGMVANLLVVFDGGGRLVARSGNRLDNGDMQLDHAAYSPCAVENAEGCSRDPSWQVRAARVYYDRAHDRIRYQGARVELFGLPLIPLPGLSHPASTAAGSGFLVPDVRLDRVNGIELAIPYYLRLSPSRDLLVTPHIFSGAAPMADVQVRGLTSKGAWQVHGYGTYSERQTVSGVSTSEQAFRGYLDATGGLQFDPRWSISASARVTTDRTFLRRYDISRDDRLRSTFTLARNGGSSYLTIAGWAVQTLRTNDSQGQQAIALPAIDFRQRIDDPIFGGRVLLQANSLALTRTDGQDTQRLFASAQWDWRQLTTMGQEIKLTAVGRGDIYHTQSVDATPVASYRGQSGWQGRIFGSAAIDVSWPLVGQLAGGNQRLTPRVQIVGTTPINNVDIPNEDSRAFELEDGNIFAINRFPGYDRYEDGARITYGVEWAYDRPGIALTSSIAQSYRMTNQPALFADGTGLTTRSSDIVGRTSLSLRNIIRFDHRYRLDKDTLAIRRNEIDATIGTRRTYAVIGYLRLNRDIASLGEDLSDREEVRVGGRVQVARYWSLFGSATVDLTGTQEDPTSTADGFEPIRHRVGVAYEDECLSIGLTWRRDYQDSGDARRGNTFLLRVAFRNLGV